MTKNDNDEEASITSEPIAWARHVQSPQSSLSIPCVPCGEAFKSLSDTLLFLKIQETIKRGV